MMNLSLRAASRFFFALIALLLLGPLASFSQAGWTGKEVYGIAPDGTELHWVVYTPSTPGPWPAVLVIHGGGFKAGGPPSGAQCGLDLAEAGYLAFSIEYRLAPEGVLPGQTSDGRFPQQTDDVKMAIRAARADARCNGQVGAIGGSAGGTHTAYCSVTGTKGDDRLDVGVSLSGAYDFSDFSSDPNIAAFTSDVTNYVGVGANDTAALRAASPVDYVDPDAAPLFLVNSAEDPMPFGQLGDMTRKLDSLGINAYQQLTLPGSAHAFDYWSIIRDQVIGFLDARFAGLPFPPPTPTPSATPAATPANESAPTLVNVSTRAHVGSGDQVMIGGFIITGAEPKNVLLRGLGPSLGQAGVSNALGDPVLEVYNQAGALIARNDNWTSLPPDLASRGFAPRSALESVVVATLPTGSYTAVLSGANATTGTALLEIYDLSPPTSMLSNISTRGEVASTADPMIGGFIINGTDPAKVLVRALGPSLRPLGVEGALADPTLELRNSDGSLIFANDNWRTTQEAQIRATSIPPNDDREAAIIATLPPGSYTAIVNDSGAGSGIALVEVYHLP